MSGAKMFLTLNVLHNPGTLHFETEMPGYVPLLVSTVVPKDIKNIIDNTKSNKYVVGDIIFNKENLLEPKTIDIIIPFKELKDNFDVSETITIFKCYISDKVLRDFTVRQDIKLSLNIDSEGSVFKYVENLPKEVIQEAKLHSVFIEDW